MTNKIIEEFEKAEYLGSRAIRLRAGALAEKLVEEAKYKDVDMLDNYFGEHQYGVVFSNGEVLREEDCEFIDKNMACGTSSYMGNTEIYRPRFCCWCGKIEHTKLCESKSLKKVIDKLIKKLWKKQ